MRLLLGILLPLLLNSAMVLVLSPQDAGMALLILCVISVLAGIIVGVIWQMGRVGIIRIALPCLVYLVWVAVEYRNGYGQVNDDFLVGANVSAFIVAVFGSLRYRSETPPNHCTKCGYCLVGLPEPRCPECGTPFDPAVVIGFGEFRPARSGRSRGARV